MQLQRAIVSTAVQILSLKKYDHLNLVILLILARRTSYEDLKIGTEL